MIALLLAQLVMPSPSVEPLSPPGMVCMGECSDGPMVWRASPARGRLVVACDMRSDTCSDGRKITTTRATPVPCEVAPGVWEMVPEDTGCYGVRGLEAWAATTSYLSWGAELDRSPWQAVDGATVQSLPTGGYRVIGTGSNSRIMQPYIPAVPGPHTLSCIARSDDETPQARMRIYWDTSSPASVAIPVTAEWAVHSITATVPEEWEGNISIHVYSRTGTVDVIGCWLTRTDTPGRPCWGGEAPVTCAADRHTISTEGWPTEAGEIEITFTAGPSSNSRHLFDSRTSGVTPTYGVGMYLTPTDGLVAIYCAGDCSNRNKSAITLLPVNHVRYKWSDSLAQVWLNGEEVLSWEPSVVIESHSETASLGSHGSSNSNHLNGSIYSLRIRSFE